METLVRNPVTADSAFETSGVVLDLEQARLVAEAEIEKTRHRTNSEFDAGQLVMDSISSARRYAQNPTAENLQHVEKDAFYTAFEAISARITHITPAMRYRWDGEDYAAGGQRLIDMTANCLQGYDITPTEVSEYVLSVIPSLLYKKGHMNKVIRTISLPKQFGADTQLMARDFWFEEVEDEIELVSQQLAYVGDNLTPQHIDALQSVIGGGQVIDDEHIRTYIMDEEEADSLEEVGDTLDSFIGDEVVGGRYSSQDRSTYYENLAVQTEELSKHAAELAPTIGALSIDLAQRDVRPEFSNPRYKKVVDRLAHELSRQNPEVARSAFGEEVAYLYRMAEHAELSGDIDSANYIRDKAREKQTLVCEAGSCGLEAPTNTEFTLARSLGLEGEVLTLKERACPSCKQSGGILIDEKGNMACAHCKESNVSIKKRQPVAGDDE